VVNDDHPETYRVAFEAYREMFADMSDSARASWFFVSDESVLLSFDVANGETPEQAEARHAVKLSAMADALESLPCAEAARSTIADLRRLSRLHS
jgi:hypothetical protein